MTSTPRLDDRIFQRFGARLSTRTAAALVFCLSLPASLAAQEAAPTATQPPMTTLKVFARRVTVDVVVTDNKDRPVKGLARTDFQVFEDGTPQAVRSFDAHVLERQPGPPQTPPGLKLPPHTYANLVTAPQDGPVTVILYDVLNTPISAMPYAHEAMVKFIKNQPKGSRTAIFVLGTNLRMLEGFTDDETRLLAAINGKAAGTQQSSLLLNAANSGISTTDLTTDNPQIPVDPTATGPTSLLGELNSMETMENLLMLRERMDATVEAFAEIARFLTALPGRKNLLWLSGSFPGSVLPSSDPGASGTASEFGNSMDFEREMKKANDLMNAAHVSVYPVDVRGLQTDPTFSASNNTKFSSKAPPKSTFSSDQNAEHSTMDDIADNTGGHAFYNTNGLNQAMQQAMDQGSVYYTLSYTPSNPKFDGSMRKIRVDLARSGYHLSYRKSYFADDLRPNAPGVSAPEPLDPITNSMKHGAPISTELFFETTILPAQGPMPASPQEMAQLSQFAAPPSKKHPASGEPTKVQHYDIEFSLLGRMLSMPELNNGKFGLKLTFAVAAFDADGLLENGLEIQVNEPISGAEHDRVKSGAYRTKLSVALPLDARWLRIAVRDTAGGHTGTLEVPVPNGVAQ